MRLLFLGRCDTHNYPRGNHGQDIPSIPLSLAEGKKKPSILTAVSDLNFDARAFWGMQGEPECAEFIPISSLNNEDLVLITFGD